MNGNRPGATRERLYASTTATFDGDIDFIAIERVLNGDPVRLTAQEQLLTARLLDSRGVTATAIGKLIRADHTTVSRWKDNGWNAGPPPARRMSAPRTPPQCGEARMYRRHLKLGEPPCAACRAANAAADRRYRLTGSQKAPS